jgi:hypothetical protein
MTHIRRVLTELASSRGIILALTVLMAGYTLTVALDDALRALPLRPLLVALSTISFVIGIGVLIWGRRPEMVGWVGATAFAYGLIRASLWLSTGSITGFLAWQPLALLGFAVWERRQFPYTRGEEDEPTP